MDTGEGKKISTPLIIGLGAVAVLVIGGLLFFLRTGEESQQHNETGQEQTAGIQEEEPKDLGELIIEDIEVGGGAEVIPGNLVQVHYTGAFEDGAVFDSSRERGVPFEFQLGVGQVIEGWDIGLEGMKVGGKRRLIIPSHLGYGEEGNIGIPGNTTLHFEIELLKIIEVKG